MATILQELLQSLEGHFAGRSAPSVLAIHPPPGGSDEGTSPFTLVVLDTEPKAAGLSYNLLEDPEGRARYDALDLAALVSRGDALQLAREVLDDDPATRVVGYAACHALSQLVLRERGAQRVPSDRPPWRESEEDLVQLLRLHAADHVGLVGVALRIVRSLDAAGAGPVTVLERPTRAAEIARAGGATLTTAPGDLARCNKVLITSTNLHNGTFDDLEQQSRGAEHRAVYGPGAGVLPDVFFARGIDAVAGLVVTDAETLVRRQLGGKKWGDAKRKLVLTRAESARA